MDNISHSLVAISLAEWVHQQCPAKETPSRIRRMGFWISSIVAGNLPDIDFLWARRLGPQDLGYLLQHRGHTHTFIAVLPQALLVLGIVYGLFRLRGWKLNRPEWVGVMGLAVLGPFAHISLDWLNSYGVHPFWPFHNRWYYGDSLFIVEPLVWISLLAPLVWSFQRRILFGLSLVAVAVAVALVLVWVVPMVPTLIAVLVSLYAIGLVFLLGRVSALKRVLIGLGLFLSWVACFSIFSSVIERQVRDLYSRTQPGVRLHDVVLSPLPSNLMCWRIWTVEAFDTRQSYVVRRGWVVPFPSLMNAAKCASGTSGGMANIGSDDLRSRLVWLHKDEFSLASWREILSRQCPAQAYLVFSRVPSMEKRGQETILSDLRFDMRRGGRSFTEFRLTGEQPTCGFPVPNWDAPRAELFGLGS